MYSYPFHRGDYLKDTIHLTGDEDLTYRRMIDLYYDTEGPLPDDPLLIAKRTRCPVNTVSSILSEFFTKQKDGWHQPRCDREIAAYHGRQAGAKKAAAARWGNAPALPPHSERNANREPRTENREPNGTSPRRKKAAPGVESGPPAGDQRQGVTTPLPEKEVARRAANEAVWAAYSTAHRRRYGTLPVRNLTVNSKIAALVKRVGGETAVALASWYVEQSMRKYELHPVGLLLRDCEQLVTAMQAGVSVQDGGFRRDADKKAAALTGGAA